VLVDGAARPAGGGPVAVRHRRIDRPPVRDRQGQRPVAGGAEQPRGASVELRDGDVGGIAEHIAARVLAAASPGEVLVSRTVRDLVTGSDTVLEDRGAHRLKGIEGTWRLFAVGG